MKNQVWIVSVMALCLVGPQVYAQEAGMDASGMSEMAPPASTAAAPSGANRMVVSIASFENETNAAPEAFQTLRSRITNDIINTRKFQIVERQNLKKVLQEQNLAAAGMTDGEDTPRAGRLKGAGFTIYGSVLHLGLMENAAAVSNVMATKRVAKVEIQLRFADAETGEIVASKTIIGQAAMATMESANNVVAGTFEAELLQGAIRDASKKVTWALTDLAFPAKVLKVGPSGILVNLTQEQTELNAVYEVFQPGEELIDPDSGESLGSEEMLAGRIQIADRKPKYAVGMPLPGTNPAMIASGMLVRRIDPEIVRQNMEAARQEARQNFKSRF